MLPVSADERLEEEQKAVREFRERQAQRSTTLRPFEITTVVTMIKESNQLFFETTINNQIKDHRLRVLFPTGMVTETHEADSIYEVVTRPNQVSDTWENPTNPQHQQAFVNVHDQNKGVTIFNEGLNEYEVLADGTIAVTLIRCVGELGDWGYFATPEAQCQENIPLNMVCHCMENQKNALLRINKPIVHKFLLLQLLLRVMKVN